MVQVALLWVDGRVKMGIGPALHGYKRTDGTDSEDSSNSLNRPTTRRKER
jgi:hypothetical protein